MTSSTLTYQTALKLVKIAKEACPNCITIAGGSHVSFWDDHALEECPELDIVVRREGENTMLELVQRIEAGKSYDDVLGTTCRKEGKIVRNPDRPYIEDLDSLPFPARHLWPMEKFRELEDILYLVTIGAACIGVNSAQLLGCMDANTACEAPKTLLMNRVSA